MTDNDVSPACREGQDNGPLRKAIYTVHGAGGLAVLTDELAHFSEVERALEPVLAALFAQVGAGEEPDLDEVSGDLGLLGSERPGQFSPANRARPYLEGAVRDGQAFRAVVTGALLFSDVVTRAAASRAEWSKWEATGEDDLTPAALNMDVFDAARHIARKWLMRDPTIVPAEPALNAVLGFKAAGLPTNRSVWSYALDGARAGFEDHQAHVELETYLRERNTSAVAAAFAGEAE